VHPEAAALHRPGLHRASDIRLQTPDPDEGRQHRVPQSRRQFASIPVQVAVELAILQEDSVRGQDVKMRVEIQRVSEGLPRLHQPGAGGLELVTPAAVATRLHLKPPAQDPHGESRQSAKQARVPTDPVTDAHPDRERHHHVPVTHGRKELAQNGGEVLRATAHA